MIKKAFLSFWLVFGVICIPHVSYAQNIQNSSYFGYNFLHIAAKHLHHGKDIRMLIYQGKQNDLLQAYTPENIADAYFKAWKEIDSYEKTRILAFLGVKNTVPLHSFVTGRQDQSLIQTIRHQFGRVADEAINDVVLNRPSIQLTGYKQLADTGLKAMVHVLYLMKKRGDPEYASFRQKLPETKAFMASQWADGAYLFARMLKIDHGINDRDKLAVPNEEFLFSLNAPSATK